MNGCDGTCTGFFHWIAANGDKLEGTFDGYLTPSNTAGVFDNHENADVTSGTGRFAHATGHFELGGQVDFNTYSFVLPCRGPSHLSARTKSRRDCAPDLRIATSIGLVAMRQAGEKTSLFSSWAR